MSEVLVTMLRRDPEAVDEIIAECMHFEMMDDGSAWLGVGDEAFWFYAERGRLTVRHESRRADIPQVRKPKRRTGRR